MRLTSVQNRFSNPRFIKNYWLPIYNLKGYKNSFIVCGITASYISLNFLNTDEHFFMWKGW